MSKGLLVYSIILKDDLFTQILNGNKEAIYIGEETNRVNVTHETINHLGKNAANLKDFYFCKSLFYQNNQLRLSEWDSQFVFIQSSYRTNQLGKHDLNDAT